MGESEYDIMFEDAQAIRKMYGIPYQALCWNGRFDYSVKGGKYGLYSVGMEIVLLCMSQLSRIKILHFSL